MRNLIDENGYLYDAFISYRHSELDKFVAETLHREMESFKLPGNLIRKMEGGGKVRINRVFRDRDELPIASNLADPITDALEASEFLIVICSPRLPESLWCKKEIDTFIRLHDREHVLAVLIEGEPDESFPDELRYVENKRVNSDGTVTAERIAVEPLAADVRGRNRREIRKKIKEEVVRLAAPMFDCAYDELKQRHRERRLRRILTAAAAGSCISLLVGTVSTTMALQIYRQNIEISEKSRQIEEQSGEIMAQSGEIKKQYWEALENYALGEAADAMELLAQGDRIEAVRTAKAVLPTQLEAPEIPYTYQAEYALSAGLAVYSNGEGYQADFMLKHGTNVAGYILSPDKDRLLVTDDAGVIYVWDLEAGKLLLENHEYGQGILFSEQKMDFLDNDTIFYLGNEGKTVLSIPEGTVTELEEKGEEDGLISLSRGSWTKVDRTGGKAAVLDSFVVRIWDIRKQEVILSYQPEEDWQIYNDFAFNEDGSMLAFVVKKGDFMVWDETDVLVMDTESGEILSRFSVKQEMVQDMVFDRNTLYIANFESLLADEIQSFFNMQLEGVLYACDVVSGEVKWVFTNPERPMYFVRPAGDAESELLFAASDSAVYLMDKNTGVVLGMIELAETITGVRNNKDSEDFFVYTREGHIYFVRYNNGIIEAVNYDYRFQSNSDSVRQMDIGAGGSIIVSPYYSTNITVFRQKKGEKYQDIQELKNPVSMIAVSPDGDVYAVREYQGTEVGIYDAETDEQIGVMPHQGITAEYAFVGQEKEYIAALSDDMLYLNENRSGRNLAEYELDSWECFFLGESMEQVVSVGYGDVVIYDTLTGEEKQRVPTEGKLRDGFHKAVNGPERILAIDYPDEGVMKFFSLDDMKEMQVMEINAAFVTELFFDPVADLLYVAYKDNSLDVFGCQDGVWALQKRYPPLEIAVTGVVNLGDGRRVILIGSSDSLLLKDGEVTALLPGFEAVREDDQGRMVIYAGYDPGVTDVLGKIPLYEYDMLMEEAGKY